MWIDRYLTVSDTLATVTQSPNWPRVFHQQENAGDEILHELLRAETERHAEDARARQQRRGVHAQLRQARQHHNHPNDDAMCKISQYWRTRNEITGRVVAWPTMTVLCIAFAAPALVRAAQI